MNFAVKMATRLRLEDRLDGAGNFVPWKARLVLILEENELWDEVVNNTTANSMLFPLPPMHKRLLPSTRTLRMEGSFQMQLKIM